eukprot:6208026-Pleurochrysis_carterae.AAC.1
MQYNVSDRIDEMRRMKASMPKGYKILMYLRVAQTSVARPLHRHSLIRAMRSTAPRKVAIPCTPSSTRGNLVLEPAKIEEARFAQGWFWRPFGKLCEGLRDLVVRLGEAGWGIPHRSVFALGEQLGELEECFGHHVVHAGGESLPAPVERGNVVGEADDAHAVFVRDGAPPLPRADGA